MIKLLSHLSYVEITSPDVEASVEFYVNQVGLTVVDRIDGKVYLRCWGDYYRTPSSSCPATSRRSSRRPGAPPARGARGGREARRGHRHRGRVVRRCRASAAPTGSPARGATRDPALGRRARARHRRRRRVDLPRPPHRRSKVAGAPRQLDHVTVATSDVDAFAAWYNEVLGFRIMAKTVLDEAPISVFSVLTTNEKSHDLGVVLDGSTRAGRVNHYAFWVDTREELLIAADVLMENGYPIEYGPSIHGIGEQNFLYYREPSSLRIELNTGGYRNYVPDWEPNTWRPSPGSNNFYRNSAMPMSMTESFPPADGPRRPKRACPRDQGSAAQPVRQARPGLTFTIRGRSCGALSGRPRHHSHDDERRTEP